MGEGSTRFHSQGGEIPSPCPAHGPFSDRPAATLSAAALATLGIGILYASDRDPAGVYAWPAFLPRPERAAGRLGAIGGSLPSLVHTYALILLAAVNRPTRVGLQAMCLSWGLVEALLLCGPPRLAAASRTSYRRAGASGRRAARPIPSTSSRDPGRRRARVRDRAGRSATSVPGNPSVMKLHQAIRSRASASSLRRALAALAVVAFGLLTILGCGGGGGGGDDDDDVPDSGTWGTGDGGIPIFWFRYGGNQFGAGFAGVPTQDGGFVATGFLDDQSLPDGLSQATTLVRTNARGQVQWLRKHDWADQPDWARDVQATVDGGFVLAGTAQTSLGNSLWRVLKLGAAGDLEWERTYGPESYWKEAYAVRETVGGYALAGSRFEYFDTGVDGRAVLMKISASGDVVWERTYGNERNDEAFSFDATSDGGFVLGGRFGGTHSAPAADVWLVRTDGEGDLLWQRTYGEGEARCVRETADGGFVIAGWTIDPGARRDLLVVRTDGAGDELWRRTFGGSDDDWAEGVAELADGGVVAAGCTRSISPGTQGWQREDLYHVKLDAAGNTLWHKVKGKSPDSSDLAASVLEVADGGLLMAGGSGASILLTKLDRKGNTVDLGDRDLTLNLPDVEQGIIDFGNGIDVAVGSLDALDVLRGAGPFVLGILEQALDGGGSGDICSFGGTVTFDPVPTPPLEAGQSFAIAFDQCGADQDLELDGDLVVTVDDFTGDLGGAYDVTLAIQVLFLTVTDDVGTTALAGDLRFRRVAADATHLDELTEVPAGSTLSISEDGWTDVLTATSLAGSRAGGVVTLGPALASLGLGELGGAVLEVAIEAGSPFVGGVDQAPSSGALSATASDASTVTLRAVDALEARVEIDTDGDGVVDLVIPIAWDDVF